jgi:hypothetical protein
MSAEKEEVFLYWGSGSTPCWRVQIALEEKSIAYGQKLLSFDKNEHKTEEMYALNPRGQVLIQRIHFIMLICVFYMFYIVFLASYLENRQHYTK